MIEIPEAAVIARQANEALYGKSILKAQAGKAPHKFAWFSGDPASYSSLLAGKMVGAAASLGGMLSIQVEDVTLLFTDGINLRYHPTLLDAPEKHQLLLEFADGSAASVSVAMYGGLWCSRSGENQNPYYIGARDKPSPLTEAFSSAYFDRLFQADCEKLSMKAFLATQQRIPGLGNGVLQDILYQARLHPKSKAAALDAAGREQLYLTIRDVLQVMADQGGRDTEKDLFGNPGGYITRLSKNTVGQPCPACGSKIQKQAYLGGSIYFCPGCQVE